MDGNRGKYFIVLLSVWSTIFFNSNKKKACFFFSGQGSVLYICTYSSRVVFTFVHTILLYHSINNLILLTTFQPSDCYMFGADWHPPSAVRRKY